MENHKRNEVALLRREYEIKFSELIKEYEEKTGLVLQSVITIRSESHFFEEAGVIVGVHIQANA